MPFKFEYSPTPTKGTFFWIEGFYMSSTVKEVELKIDDKTFLVSDNVGKRFVIQTNENNSFGEYIWRVIREYPSNEKLKEPLIQQVKRDFQIEQ